MTLQPLATNYPVTCAHLTGFKRSYNAAIEGLTINSVAIERVFRATMEKAKDIELQWLEDGESALYCKQCKIQSLHLTSQSKASSIPEKTQKDPKTTASDEGSNIYPDTINTVEPDEAKLVPMQKALERFNEEDLQPVKRLVCLMQKLVYEGYLEDEEQVMLGLDLASCHYGHDRKFFPITKTLPSVLKRFYDENSLYWQTFLQDPLVRDRIKQKQQVKET